MSNRLRTIDYSNMKKLYIKPIVEVETMELGSIVAGSPTHEADDFTNGGNGGLDNGKTEPGTGEDQGEAKSGFGIWEDLPN